MQTTNISSNLHGAVPGVVDSRCFEAHPSKQTLHEALPFRQLFEGFKDGFVHEPKVSHIRRYLDLGQPIVQAIE